jgi:putative transposase
MPDFRRAYIPGATYFFTLVTEERARWLCSELARACLRQAIVHCRQRWPFSIVAIVLLPDHLHTIWSLPRGDTAYPRRWAAIKREFTTTWLAAGGAEAPVTASRQRQRRRGVLQRRYWEHVIRDERDFERHADYIHYNPVKHGLCQCPGDWPYSSFRRFVRSGDYPPDWACGDRRVQKPLDFSDLEDTARE